MGMGQGDFRGIFWKEIADDLRSVVGEMLFMCC